MSTGLESLAKATQLKTLIISLKTLETTHVVEESKIITTIGQFVFLKELTLKLHDEYRSRFKKIREIKG